MNLNYLTDHFRYQIFRIILSIKKIKKMKKRLNPLIKMHVNKIENRITFRIKKGYHLELLMPKTMKSLKSTEKK